MKEGWRDGGEMMRCTAKGFHGNVIVAFFFFPFIFLPPFPRCVYSHVWQSHICCDASWRGFYATRSLTHTTTQPTNNRWSLAEPLGLFLTQAGWRYVLLPGSSKIFRPRGGRGLHWHQKKGYFLWWSRSKPFTSTTDNNKIYLVVSFNLQKSCNYGCTKTSIMEYSMEYSTHTPKIHVGNIILSPLVSVC